MKGSIRKRGSKWSYRVELGRENGKRSQIVRGGFKTKKEAEKAMADTICELNNHGEMVENVKIVCIVSVKSIITCPADKRNLV